jgi:hypothetical protein
MPDLDLARHGPAAAALIQEAKEKCFPEHLTFGPPKEAYRERLAALKEADLGPPGAAISSRDDAEALLSGLWLLFDFYEESHVISQGLHTPSGSYWHGIAHRREPDPSNASYWFRRVGAHPVFMDLQADVRALLAEADDPGLCALGQADVWDPFQFIKLTTVATPATQPLLLEIQRMEWRRLYAYNFQHAFG